MPEKGAGGRLTPITDTSDISSGRSTPNECEFIDEYPITSKYSRVICDLDEFLSAPSYPTEFLDLVRLVAEVYDTRQMIREKIILEKDSVNDDLIQKLSQINLKLESPRLKEACTFVHRVIEWEYERLRSLVGKIHQILNDPNKEEILPQFLVKNLDDLEYLMSEDGARLYEEISKVNYLTGLKITRLLRDLKTMISRKYIDEEVYSKIRAAAALQTPKLDSDGGGGREVSKNQEDIGRSGFQYSNLEDSDND